MESIALNKIINVLLDIPRLNAITIMPLASPNPPNSTSTSPSAASVLSLHFSKYSCKNSTVA